MVFTLQCLVDTAEKDRNAVIGWKPGNPKKTPSIPSWKKYQQQHQNAESHDANVFKYGSFTIVISPNKIVTLWWFNIAIKNGNL